jgi:hypothetical protein
VRRIGKVSYKLELPPELTGVHPVFHMSPALDVQETLEYLEYPVWILD